jgi:DNA-binding transcriptional LysR family regulator
MQYGLTDLRVFLAVVDERSVSRGAQRCHLANSSVSQRIAALESELDVALLQRHARGVIPTPAGHVLAAHARRCLAQLEQMHTDLAPYANNMKGHVTVFANSSSLASYLPAALRSFLTANPSVRVTLQEAMSGDIVSAVANGRADIGIVAGEVEHPRLDFLPYRQDELVLLLPVGHALTKTPSAQFIEALDEPFVCLHSGSAIHTFITEKATALGYRLDVRVQVNDYRTISTLVASGAGVAVVPRSVLSPCDTGTIPVTLNESWARRDLRICIRHAQDGTENPHLRSLLEHLLAPTVYDDHPRVHNDSRA